jgi:CheY-like chemotaxis protein
MEANRQTILLVDDEAIIIDVTGAMLEQFGYDVRTAGSGPEAIDYYQAHRVGTDLVILDLAMPGMDGGDTYDRLKAIDPEVRVILSSGYCLDGQARTILERGCNGFIQKPFNMQTLSQKINEVLDYSDCQKYVPPRIRREGHPIF